jgi:hypothetical protein
MKRRAWLFLVLLLFLFSFLAAYKYFQHILVWQVNPGINAAQVKLMMAEEEVQALLGTGEMFPGFGGYRLEFPAKGIRLTFLDDGGTDFYRKVQEIQVYEGEYAIFGIGLGSDYAEAVRKVKSLGFRESEGRYWRFNLYLRLENRENRVASLAIGVRDRVAARRIY